MRTEAELELEQFVINQLDGGNRTAFRDRSPVFEVRSHSLPDGTQQTVIHHNGRRKVHPVDDLAAVDAMDKSELPTKTVDGKERRVHEGNYKRKERKRIERECAERLLEELVAVSIAGGYENAGGIVQGGKLVIYREGLSVREDIE